MFETPEQIWRSEQFLKMWKISKFANNFERDEHLKILKRKKVNKKGEKSKKNRKEENNKRNNNRKKEEKRTDSGTF